MATDIATDNLITIGELATRIDVAYYAVWNAVMKRDLIPWERIGGVNFAIVDNEMMDTLRKAARVHQHYGMPFTRILKMIQDGWVEPNNLQDA